MILLRFSYQVIYAGINRPRRFANGESCLYILLDVPKTAPLGVWNAIPNAWHEGYEDD